MNDPMANQAGEMRPTRPTRGFAAAAIALGVSVLVGWALGVESLTRVLPGLIAMKPNAALAFLLAGLALWSILDGRPAARRAVVLSLAVAAIGGLTLLEYLAKVELGIDLLLFRNPVDPIGMLYPGRMHPTTAFDFLVLGLASAMLAANREHRAAQLLVLVAAFVAGATLIGYIYGVRDFVQWASYTQMALHTALGMLVLSVGLLAASSGWGIMVPIADHGPSGLMARWLLPVAILTPIVATGLTMLARRAGLFDEQFGSAIRVMVVVSVFVACIWRSAEALYRIDTERRRVEAERIEGETRFQFLAESMPQIVWRSHADGQVAYLNRRWFEYTGLSSENGTDWHRVFHPDDLDPCLESFNRSKLLGQTFQGEFRYRRADGVYRWHLVRAEPMADESGQVASWIGTATDVDDQKRAGEQRYRSLVEATSSIVWNATAEGQFESVNPGWTAFTGQEFEQYRGWGRLEVTHPDDREAMAQAWRKAIEGRGVYESRHRLRHADGQYRHMLVRAVPILDMTGEIREWIGTHSDIDDRERAHEAMREAKEAAEAATRAKAEFLANMSHEIRTPMNGILGMTELALSTELSPRQREYLGLAKASADALLRIIDDILDFSKIEAGKLTLEPISFAPRDLLTNTLRCLALKAHQKGLELACRIAPEVPELVVGDPGRLRQVFINLVGNAIKFTERGEVVATLEVDPAEGLPLLRFSIVDTGIGIPEAKRASIFDPFEQADGSTTRKYGGTGLGLSISSRLIALMGGRIWLEENPGGGSIFRFTARLEPDLGGADRSSPGSIVLESLRILIVDDNRTNRMILEEILSQWGCRPTAVEGAAEALEIMGRAADRGEPFPLVMLDRMMPEMDGCGLAAQIKADARLSSARMMMLTSGGSEEGHRAAELGIGAWLAKPIRQSELLGSLLDLMAGVPQALAPPLPWPTTPDILPGVRPLRVLLAEDHPINQKVASRMLQDQGHEVVIVDNGRRAVEALAADPGGFDIVLMDLAMPEMGGFEALGAIRAAADPGAHHVPIVALTAHAMSGDRERCLAAGFDDYLAKPVQAAKLAEALARVAGKAGRPTDPASPSRDGTATDARPAFDLKAALRALDDDESLLIEILGMFLEDAPQLVAEARRAVEARDAQTLMRMGHTLAGSAGHFAADGLVTAARALEAIGKRGGFAEAESAALAFEAEFERFRLAADEALASRRPPAVG